MIVIMNVWQRNKKKTRLCKMILGNLKDQSNRLWISIKWKDKKIGDSWNIDNIIYNSGYFNQKLWISLFLEMQNVIYWQLMPSFSTHSAVWLLFTCFLIPVFIIPIILCFFIEPKYSRCCIFPFFRMLFLLF